MEEKQKFAFWRLLKNRETRWGFVLLVLLVIVNFIQFGFYSSPYQDSEIWILCNYGEGVRMYLQLIIVVVILIFFVAIKIIPIQWENIFKCKWIYVIEILLILINILLSLALTSKYDVIYYSDENGYVFTSYELGNKSSYMLNDVTLFEVNGYADMRLYMKDETVIHLACGITEGSDAYRNGYEWGQFEYELSCQITGYGIKKVVNNSDRIEKTIEKYQARNDLKFWHEYLPEIIAE